MVAPLRTARFAAAFALPMLYSSAVAAPLAPHPKSLTTTELAEELLPPIERVEPSVVLVVLDGVRWQEIANGADMDEARRRHYDAAKFDSARKLVPNLYRLAERGSLIAARESNHEISATGPNFISLPGYTEILTGRPDPSCESNFCKRPDWPSLPDLLRIHGFEANEVAVFSSWSTIERAATASPREITTSCGRGSTDSDAILSNPVAKEAIDAGDKAKPFPGDLDYRPDTYTSKAALAYLEAAKPRFMFIGLGDTDEYGHRNDYKSYLEALHAADETVGAVLAILDRSGSWGKHTTVLVTADHGRAQNFHDHGKEFPESGRVWLAAGGGSLRTHHSQENASHSHTLSDVAPTILHLLGLRSELGKMVGTPIDDLSSRGTVAAR